MNKIFFFLFSFISLGVIAQGSAGVYKMRWRIDKRLTTGFQMEIAGQGTTQDYNRFRMSDYMRDLVVDEALSTLDYLLNSKTELIYRKQKNGNSITTYSSQESVGGLPRSTKRKAIKEFEQDLYVRVYINVGSYKTTVFGFLGNGAYRIRPIVTVKIKAFGPDRRKVYKKRVRLSDFEKLNSVSYNIGNTTVTNSQTLNSEEIKEMVLKALQQMTSLE